MFIPGVFLNTVNGGRANAPVVDVDGVPSEAGLRGPVRAGAVGV